MTAPVSLAEIKGLNRADCGYIHLRQKERDALVELAEAYLAVREDGQEIIYCDGPEQRAKRARLALAAKGVRP